MKNRKIKSEVSKLKRLKLIITIILVIIVVAAALVIWKSGGIKIVIEQPEKTIEPKTVTEPQKPADTNKPGKITDVNTPVKTDEPKEPNKPAEPNEPNEPAEPNEPQDPNEIMEALNLKDVQMKDIIQKLGDWTGKPIIPTNDEVLKQKITIYSPQEVPRKQALSLIYSALRAKGFVAEHTDDAIYLKPVKEAIFGSVPTIPTDQPLAGIKNKDQIVQKFFKLENYSPVQMSNILLPLIGEYGYVSADENTGDLLVIDTVKNLMRFERIVIQFDVPEAEQTVTEIFEIHHGDPSEIVQLLRILLGDTAGGRSARRGRGAQPAPSGRAQPAKPGASKGQTPATSVSIGPSKTPIVLIPEPRRKWIIAKASAEDMKQIAEWIEKLDKKEPVESESETIPIVYADVSEVANRLNQALREMPGTELRASVLVQPLPQARQIMVFGRKDMREMVIKIIEEIDIPPGQFETQVFPLKHADPDEIKENIDELYEDINANIPWWRRRYTTSKSSDTVKVISFPTMQQVTVIASAENMRKIEAQIEEWDIPLDVERVKPLIITLQNSDPVQMADLLTKLFTEETSTSSPPWWRWWASDDEKKKKIVGALYGQLTFEPVPDTKKIIVISKIPEAYDVIKDLVNQLDSMEVAELPMVVTLNYADAEDLCDQLNAILNEPGTTATIRRSKRGLSDYSTEDDGTTKSDTDQDTSISTDIITPWWNKARSREGEEMPTSNLIGRIRFIPVHRSKAILVLSPIEYQQSLKEMIKALDQPGKQVMIKAIIVEVDHSEMTSLGVRLSSNITSFGTIGENAINALTKLSLLEEHGSFKLDASMSVNTLVDLLIKEAHGKVLNQPTLWTKDNEEAEFFKGQRIAFIESSQTSQEGTAQSSEYKYDNVGVTLRVRPNITPEKNVDVTINLIISQVEQELINTQVARSELNTTTHLIVEDGQTIMMGGILFKNESEIERKVPLFGDIPLLGGLFRHYDMLDSNNELLVFITPYVVDANSSVETIEELGTAEEKLESVLEDLEQLNEKTDANNLEHFK